MESQNCKLILLMYSNQIRTVQIQVSLLPMFKHALIGDGKHAVTSSSEDYVVFSSPVEFQFKTILAAL